MTDPGAPAVAAQVPPTTPPTTTIPPTGSSSTEPALVIANLMIAVGLALLAARRRAPRKKPGLI